MNSIALDLDGCLYDWHLSVYNFFVNFREYKGTWTEFWTTEYKKFDEDWWKSFVQIDILYSDRPPTEDCKYFLDNIKERFQIFYITSRPITVKTTTEQYLRRHKFPFKDNLIFTDDKVNQARLLRVQYALDDLPRHVESLSKVTTVIMVAKPWNRELWDIYPTVKTLTQALNFIKE